MAARDSKDLAAPGMTMKSGLECEIEASAHQRDLSWATRASVGLFGWRMDGVYQNEKKWIFEQIRRRGAITGQFRARTFAASQDFPIRNRIIGGMVLGGCGRPGARSILGC